MREFTRTNPSITETASFPIIRRVTKWRGRRRGSSTRLYLHQCRLTAAILQSGGR